MTIISSHETDLEGIGEDGFEDDDDDFARALPDGGLGLLERDSRERIGLFSRWTNMMSLVWMIFVDFQVFDQAVLLSVSVEKL
jgi:hypothetical protein